MKNMVITLLSQTEVSKIKFSFGSMSVDSKSFQQVKAKVSSGKIKIAYNAKLGPKVAKYRYTHNTLFVGFKTTGKNADREALLVHECTHAASDIAGKKTLLTHSEAAAYIAQCLYFYYKNEAKIKKGAKPTFAQAVLREAWKVAMKAVSNSTLSNSDVQPLFKAIAKNPTYMKRHSQQVGYDGV
jgi:hypothetical protein